LCCDALSRKSGHSCRQRASRSDDSRRPTYHLQGAHHCLGNRAHMTDSPATAARLARLLRELGGDVLGLDARAAETSALLSTCGSATPLRNTIIVVAVNIHGWYTALEAALERTARLLDETVPSGPGWHADLVSQLASAVPGLRPAVVDPDLEIALAELRKFRH